MLLRLILGGRDFNGRPIQVAEILKWRKVEGEAIYPGDDLCDLWVREVSVPEGLWQVRGESWMMIKDPRLMAELAASLLRGESPVSPGDPSSPLGELNPEAFDPANAGQCGFLTRITSSDAGILRRIYAGVGGRRQAGDLLALISTSETEPIDTSDETLEKTAILRVVENLVFPPLFSEDDAYPAPTG